MKNQPGIMKNHENSPGTIKNQPVIKKKTWIPTWYHEKPT